MNITLVRHAQVDEKFKGRYNGHLDISLSNYGKTQARELGVKLQKLHFDKVYCSDLKRARETLKEFDLELPTIFSEKLREKSWGIHEGKSFEEIEKSGIKYTNFQEWIDTLDGENSTDYRKKVKEYFYTVIVKDSAKSILIVTHGGLISTLFSIVKDISLEEAFQNNVEYASLVELNIPLNLT